jgi:mannosyltransferase OCH1-like enzyme
MSYSKIPKNIYQTWSTKDMSDDFKMLTQSWRFNNPNYSYYFFDDNDCEEFIKNNFSENVYKAYCKIIPGAFKADLWRYCILYINGGVYTDMDTVCLSSIDNFINDDKIEFMTPIDLNNCPCYGKYNLFNAFIASVPKHPILLKCINIIVHNVENNIVPFSNLDFSGPGVLGKSTNSYLELDEESSFLGKEGIIKNIKLLNFEYGTEYVKYGEHILFQNKNGNPTIQYIYNNEIKRVNHIDWGTCSNPIR